MLISFSGLPGTGKSTLARAIAERRQAVYLRIDVIEQALRDSGMLTAGVGAAGYVVGCALAESNLRLGRVVVADSVNPVGESRSAWRAAAANSGVPIVEIEVVCSDPAEHRERIESRAAEVPGLVLPTWAEVLSRDYQAWDGPRVVMDTAGRGIAEAVAALDSEIGRRA